MNRKNVPIWHKTNLTIEEAAAYSNIGLHKLREITNDEDCQFVLWVGNKRLKIISTSIITKEQRQN